MKTFLVILAIAVLAIVAFMLYKQHTQGTARPSEPPDSRPLTAAVPVPVTTGNPWADMAAQAAPYAADIVGSIGRSGVITQVGQLPGQIVGGVLQPVISTGRMIVNAPVNLVKEVAGWFK